MGQSVSYEEPAFPELKGKVAVVTGASSGIGYITALELARKGAHVFVCGRNEAKTRECVEKIQSETKNPSVEYGALDLASLKSVNAFADKFAARNLNLHILVNNAGIMATEYALSTDGIEAQFATNHVGHFLLTQRLLPIIERSQPARIVNVSSALHSQTYKDGIHLNDINDKSKYAPYTRYGETKLANILFTTELQRRLDAKNANNQIYVNACHPGLVATNLITDAAWGGAVTAVLMRPFQISQEKGAYTQYFLATHPSIVEKNIRGRYFVPYAKPANTTATGRDAAGAQALYQYTEKLLTEKLGDAYHSFV